MTEQLITLKVEKELLNKVDQTRKKTFHSRSGFIRLACESLVNSVNQKEEGN